MHRHHAFLIPFSDHPQIALLQVYLIYAQLAHLTDTKTAAIQQLQNGFLIQSLRILSKAVQQQLDIMRIEIQGSFCSFFPPRRWIEGSRIEGWFIEIKR